MTLPSPAPGGFDGVAEILAGAVDAGAFPGAVILIAQRGEVLYHEAFGSRSIEPERTPMARDTVFDLSSLTKPLATTTAVMLLAREGKLRPDDRVTRFIPNFGVHGKFGVSVRHLLAHCSGLPAWRPFYEDITRGSQGRADIPSSRGAREFVYERIHRERLEQSPGTRAVYSDLGFLLLGELIELVTQSPLDRVCHERIFRPLGLRATGFIDLSRLRRDKLAPITDAIAPTERCPWRQKVLCGEVHDDNAWAVGGVAGHAGLFSTAADVHVLASWLRACARDEDPTLPGDIVRRFWTRDGTVADSTWALGWDTPSATASSAGTRVSQHAVGHLGFTGTSLWIDLERDAHVILLTNRVHPERHDDRIRALRPRVHDAVWEALDA
jgi:serine-type D-Ala-D-Ala carboxypeptidase